VIKRNTRLTETRFKTEYPGGVHWITLKPGDPIRNYVKGKPEQSRMDIHNSTRVAGQSDTSE